MKTNTKKAPIALAKGQLWRMGHAHVQIVDMGKLLVHYKLLRDLGQMRRTQMSRIDTMEVYLKTNEAQLVRKIPTSRAVKPASPTSCRCSGPQKGR